MSFLKLIGLVSICFLFFANCCQIEWIHKTSTMVRCSFCIQIKILHGTFQFQMWIHFHLFYNGSFHRKWTEPVNCGKHTEHCGITKHWQLHRTISTLVVLFMKKTVSAQLKQLVHFLWDVVVYHNYDYNQTLTNYSFQFFSNNFFSFNFC